MIPREMVVEPLLVSTQLRRGRWPVVAMGQSHAASLGVPIYQVGGKPFIDAAAFREAVRRVPPSAVANDDGDELAQLRAEMGKRRAP